MGMGKGERNMGEGDVRKWTGDMGKWENGMEERKATLLLCYGFTNHR